jgi:hypothetical protein
MSDLRTYQVTLTGLSDLIMHWDNIDWAEQMRLWREDPANKSASKAGDDRSPACTWLGSMYHDGTQVCIPSDNLMRCLMEGGAQVVVPGGKMGKTFKAQSQSGELIVEEYWPLLVNGRTIPVEPLLALTRETDFVRHCDVAKQAGFRLFTKRARIGAAKHVRVRPRFNSWSATGTLQVWDPQLTKEALERILTMAGQYKGLCDWRPSSRTPGPFGRFEAKIEEVR